MHPADVCADTLENRLSAAHPPDRLMLLGSPPDMVHGDELRRTRFAAYRADHTSKMHGLISHFTDIAEAHPTDRRRYNILYHVSYFIARDISIIFHDPIGNASPFPGASGVGSVKTG